MIEIFIKTKFEIEYVKSNWNGNFRDPFSNYSKSIFWDPMIHNISRKIEMIPLKNKMKKVDVQGFQWSGKQFF